MSGIGPQFYEFVKKLEENSGKLPASITSRTFQPEFQFNNFTCYLCNGYYGPSFGEPACVTCHEFLYPDFPHHLLSSYIFSEKKDDGDSGNDEPSVGEFMYNDRRLTRALQQQGLPNWAFRFQNSLNREASPEDPIDLLYRPRCLINPLVLPRGPSNSGFGVGGSNNCGQNAGPSDGPIGDPREFNDGPNGGPNVGPNNGPNFGGPNGGLNFGGPNGGPNNDPNFGGPNGGTNNDPNISGSNGGPIIGGSNGGPNIGGPNGGPNFGGPYGGPNDAGPSHDNGLAPAVPDDGQLSPLPSNLARSLAALSTPRLPDNLAPGLVEQLPSEVLLCIFSYLDDLSLNACALVCDRWLNLVRAHVPQPRWADFTRHRWPLFRPMINILDWHKKYQDLVESVFCHKCVVQMFKQSQPPYEENAWRRNRLRNEIKMLRSSPPEGCAATPLDPKCCHWQAMLTGPVGSPYEGGVFYLYIQIPFSYPMSPPVVRFLTRILHPNVSRHGDVGIDSVHHNWSLALTISKLLISIQSLLTDPYTAVCMEPEVGEMYVNDRVRFDRIARRWTWHYAMHDMHCSNLQSTP